MADEVDDLSNLIIQRDMAEATWKILQPQKKINGQFSKERMDAKAEFQRLRAEVTRVSKLAKKRPRNELPISTTTPSVGGENSNAAAVQCSLSTTTLSPLALEATPVHPPTTTSNPRPSPTVDSTVPKETTNVQAGGTMGLANSVLPTSKDISTVNNQSPRGEDMLPERHSASSRSDIDMDELEDDDAFGEPDMEIVPSGDQTNANASPRLDAGGNGEVGVTPSGNLDESANATVELEGVSDNNLRKDGEDNAMQVEGGEHSQKSADTDRSTFPSPRQIQNFTFAYRGVDWKKHPSLKFSAAWSPALRHLKVKQYTAQAELSFAQRQHYELSNFSQTLWDGIQRGFLKAEATCDVIYQKVRPAIDTCSKFVDQYSASVTKINGEIVALQARETKKTLVPSLKKRYAYLNAQFLHAPDNELEQIRNEMNEINKQLNAAASTSALRKRKRMKTEASNPPTLESVAGNAKLYTMPTDDAEEKPGGGGPSIGQGEVEIDEDEEEDDDDDGTPRDTLYWRTSDAGRARLSAEAEKWLQKILDKDTPEAQQDIIDQIGPSVRRAAREVRVFFPESAWTTRALALRVHETGHGNWMCLWHQRHRSPSQQQRHDTEDTFYGIGFPMKKSTAKVKVIPPKGHMHCGCAIDEVLYAFYLWKTVFTTSTNPEIDTVFHMSDTDIPAPSIRAFWVESVRWLSGLDLDDLYGPQKDRQDKWMARLYARSMSSHRHSLGGYGFDIAALQLKNKTRIKDFKAIYYSKAGTHSLDSDSDSSNDEEYDKEYSKDQGKGKRKADDEEYSKDQDKGKRKANDDDDDDDEDDDDAEYKDEEDDDYD